MGCGCIERSKRQRLTRDRTDCVGSSSLFGKRRANGIALMCLLWVVHPCAHIQTRTLTHTQAHTHLMGSWDQRVHGVLAREYDKLFTHSHDIQGATKLAGRRCDRCGPFLDGGDRRSRLQLITITQIDYLQTSHTFTAQCKLYQTPVSKVGFVITCVSLLDLNFAVMSRLLCQISESPSSCCLSLEEFSHSYARHWQPVTMSRPTKYQSYHMRS